MNQTTKAELLMSLKAKWEELNRREQAEGVALDETRAAELADHASKGLTHRQMAEATGIDHAYVTQLLTYQRFLVATATKIPERRFRAYWKQHSDPVDLRNLRGVKNAQKRADYEAMVFADIRKALDSNQEPQRHKAPRKPAEEKQQPLTAEQVQGIRQVRAQVKRHYRDKIQPALQKLIALKGQTRQSYTPKSVAGCAETIEREIKELFTLLGDLVAEESDDKRARA